MSLKSLLLAFTVLVSSQAAYAQFGLPSIPGVTSGGGGASSANATEVLKNANIALNQFLLSEQKILQALGQYIKNAEYEALLNKLKSGDLASSDEDVKTKFAVQESFKQSMDKGLEENKKLDPSQKKLAAEGMLEYFKALLASKKLVDSVQGLAKNPMGISPSSIVPLTTMAGNLPGMISASISSSGTLIKYMAANGVSTDASKKVMAEMDK